MEEEDFSRPKQPQKRKLRRKNRYRSPPQPPPRRRSHLRADEPDYPSYYSDYAIENRDLQVDTPASEKPSKVKVTPKDKVISRKEVPDRSRPEDFEVELNHDFPDYVPVYYPKDKDPDPVQLESSYEPGQQQYGVGPYEESL